MNIINRQINLVILTENPENRSWLGIGYISSALKRIENLKVDVSFFHMNNLQEALTDIASKAPFAVGLPLLQFNFYSVLKLCKEIKKVLPDTYIILGNTEASTYAEYILTNYSCVDIIALGEGEQTMVELCQRLLNQKDLSGCDGIYYRKNDTIIKNRPRLLIQDLDELDYPDRSFCTEEKTGYLLLGSRGCGGRCTFCEHATIYKNNRGYGQIRLRSMKNIIGEIKELKKDNPYCYIRFLDATFEEGTGARLYDLYTELRKQNLNIQFSIHMRSEQITEELMPNLLLLNQVGLERVFIGIEACTDYELKLFGKRASLNDNYRAMDIMQKYGLLDATSKIAIRCGLIPFHPYTTFDSLRKIVSFIRKYRIVNCIEIISRLYISGTTPITKRIISDGLLDQDENEPIINPFCYRYKEERIANVFNDFREAVLELEIDESHIQPRTIANYNLYKELGYDYDIKPVCDGYFSIMNYITDLLLYLIDKYESGTFDQYEFRNKIEILKVELLPIKQQMITSHNFFAKKLLKLKKLTYF